MDVMEQQDSMRNSKLNSKSTENELFLEPKTKDNQNARGDFHK